MSIREILIRSLWTGRVMEPRAAELVDAHRARVLAEDGQAYDGELAMFRGLFRTLRAVVRPDDVDLNEVRRLVHHHTADDAAARAEKSSPTGADATPPFFQPGITYRSRRCADLLFECLTLSADPDTGAPRAIGWRFGPPHSRIRKHKIAALDAHDWACCDWTEATDTTTTGEDGA